VVWSSVILCHCTDVVVMVVVVCRNNEIGTKGGAAIRRAAGPNVSLQL